MKTPDERVEVKSVTIDTAPACLLDGMTVLEIKSARLTSEPAARNVRTELAAMRASRDRAISATPELDLLTIDLRRVNETLWDLEEEVRICENAGDFGDRFIQSARGIIHANDRRAALKQAINRLLGSSFQEEKSFPLPDPSAGSRS